MKKVNWSGVKKVFLDVLVGVFFGAVFFGALFALAEPFASKSKCVWAEKENANLTQKNENNVVLVVLEEKMVSIILFLRRKQCLIKN